MFHDMITSMSEAQTSEDQKTTDRSPAHSLNPSCLSFYFFLSDFQSSDRSEETEYFSVDPEEKKTEMLFLILPCMTLFIFISIPDPASSAALNNPD